MPEPVGSSWADEIEEGDVTTLPPSSEKIKGDTKMVTDYSFNEDNKKVKTVRTYKVGNYSCSCTCTCTASSLPPLPR